LQGQVDITNIDIGIPEQESDDILELLELLELESNDDDSDMDITNGSSFCYSLQNLRQKGTYKFGYNCLPVSSPMITSNGFPMQLTNIADVSYQTGDTISANNIAPNSINLKKENIMELIINHNQNFDMTFEEITGSNEIVNVHDANGTAESISDWASKCNLDESQKRAFQVIILVTTYCHIFIP
jgi:hypothetical protein